jgi:hypothetical protein
MKPLKKQAIPFSEEANPEGARKRERRKYWVMWKSRI